MKYALVINDGEGWKIYGTSKAKAYNAYFMNILKRMQSMNMIVLDHKIMTEEEANNFVNKVIN